MEAIRRLRRPTAVPLIASALTTILAFMPMAILPGPAGTFSAAIATAVIIMLATSTVLALVITPVLAAWLLPRNPPRPPTGTRVAHEAAKRASTAALLDWSLRHPSAAIALALSLPITGFLAFPHSPPSSFPGTDRDQLYLQVKLADGRSIYDSQPWC